jgi:hypothetical protein
MSETNHVAEFKRYLKKVGFDIVNDTVAIRRRIPCYYKTPTGDKYLVSDEMVTIFGGSDTKDGDLGCVTFQYQAKIKCKSCRNIVIDGSAFKTAFVAKDVWHAMDMFGEWNQKSLAEMSKWEKII